MDFFFNRNNPGPQDAIYTDDLKISIKQMNSTACLVAPHLQQEKLNTDIVFFPFKLKSFWSKTYAFVLSFFE